MEGLGEAQAEGREPAWSVPRGTRQMSGRRSCLTEENKSQSSAEPPGASIRDSGGKRAQAERLSRLPPSGQGVSNGQA